MRVLINSAIAGKLIGMQFEFFNAYSCCLISVLQYISSVIVNSFVSFDEWGVNAHVNHETIIF